ncbi:MAG: hypothetical protein WCP21_04100 [Armatimonadota bacterium]
MSWFDLRNNARTTLAAALAQSATAATVADASALPAETPFLLTVWDRDTYPDPGDDANMEIVEVTAVASNALTIVRGQEGTADVAHGSGEAAANLLTAGTVKQIEDAIDGGPRQIVFTLPAVAGAQAIVRLGCAGTLTSAVIMGDVSGSTVVDVWKSSYGDYPPTASNSITASAKPTLSSQITNTDSTLTGWTKTFAEDEWMIANVDSASVLGTIILVLTYVRS